MPQTIVGSEWFDENEAAAALELPLGTVHRFYEAMLAEKRVPKAFYKGAGIVLLSGFTIMALRGRQQQPKLTISKRRKR
jgi:hypothetical protein